MGKKGLTFQNNLFNMAADYKKGLGNIIKMNRHSMGSISYFGFFYFFGGRGLPMG